MSPSENGETGALFMGKFIRKFLIDEAARRPMNKIWNVWDAGHLDPWILRRTGKRGTGNGWDSYSKYENIRAAINKIGINKLPGRRFRRTNVALDPPNLHQLVPIYYLIGKYAACIVIYPFISVGFYELQHWGRGNIWKKKVNVGPIHSGSHHIVTDNLTCSHNNI